MFSKTDRVINNRPPTTGAFLDDKDDTPSSQPPVVDDKETPPVAENHTDNDADAAALSSVDVPPADGEDDDFESTSDPTDPAEEEPVLIDPNWPTRNGKAVPKSGWPAFVEAIVSLSSTSTPPALNKVDREAYLANAQAAAKAAAEAAARQEATTRRLREERLRERKLKREFRELGETINVMIKNRKVAPVCALIGNQDGGASKTWTTNHLACEFAETTRLNPVVIEGRRNNAVGMRSLGVNPDSTKSIRELHALRETVNNANDFVQLLSSNFYGVYGVKADPRAPKDDTFGEKEAGEVIDLLLKEKPLVLIDTGNSPTDPINLGICSKAHVAAFVALPSAASVTQLKLTVDDLKEYNHSDLVQHSIYMVNMLQPGIQPEQLRSRLEAPEGAPVLGTYYDPAADDRQLAHQSTGYVDVAQEIKPINLATLKLETRVELRRALVELLKLAAKRKRGSLASPDNHPSADDRWQHIT